MLDVFFDFKMITCVSSVNFLMLGSIILTLMGRTKHQKKRVMWKMMRLMVKRLQRTKMYE